MRQPFSHFCLFYILLFAGVSGSQYLSGEQTTLPQKPPRYIGSFNLETLQILNGTRQFEQPLDCAAGRKSLTLAFSNGFITLGHFLQITEATLRDAACPVQIPEGFIPANIHLNPIEEPVLYSADSGRLILFSHINCKTRHLNTSCIQPMDFTGLSGGGIALLNKGAILTFYRENQLLRKKKIPLPPGFFTSLTSDFENNLWAYDLKSRTILIFSPEGKQLRSVKPHLPESILQCPQVFCLLPEGGFLLGGSGELWKFNCSGSPQWKLSSLPGPNRTALPAFFRIAFTGEGESFYLLDPAAEKIHFFYDRILFTRRRDIQEYTSLRIKMIPDDQQAAINLIEFCLNHDLDLLAYQYALPMNNSKLLNKIITRITEKKALLLQAYARTLESSLLLCEAERIYGQSLKIFRDLRISDPVNPQYPGLIESLINKRKYLRDIMFSEKVINADLYPAKENGIKLLITNIFPQPVERIEIASCWSGFPESRNSLFFDRLEAGGELAVSFPYILDELGLKRDEDIEMQLSMLISFIYNMHIKTQYLTFPVVVKNLELSPAFFD